jgi:hypothetical protein
MFGGLCSGDAERVAAVWRWTRRGFKKRLRESCESARKEKVGRELTRRREERVGKKGEEKESRESEPTWR